MTTIGKRPDRQFPHTTRVSCSTLTHASSTVGGVPALVGAAAMVKLLDEPNPNDAINH
jgi:hypothetical protein